MNNQTPARAFFGFMAGAALGAGIAQAVLFGNHPAAQSGALIGIGFALLSIRFGGG